jgi:hypothetical protein
MAKAMLKFVAVKTVTKPVRVKFKMKSGKTVYFKALKTLKKRQVGKRKRGPSKR